jgi:hypothetical protein
LVLERGMVAVDNSIGRWPVRAPEGASVVKMKRNYATYDENEPDRMKGKWNAQENRNYLQSAYTYKPYALRRSILLLLLPQRSVSYETNPEVYDA